MIRIATLLISAFACFPALAASSQWQTSEGGAVRLITSGLPDKQGKLRGALEIKLEPGWKTYWQNPGPSGIPPQIDISGSPQVRSADIAFPAPKRVNDGYSEWAGYTAPVTLPLIFTLDPPDATGLIDAQVFLGICETICIPFEASFTFDPDTDPDNRADALTVEMAHAALPEAAMAQFGITQARRQGAILQIEANVPERAENAVLFMAGAKSHLLGTPHLEALETSKARFAVELFDNKDDALTGQEFDYTLVAGDRAVAGKIELP